MTIVQDILQRMPAVGQPQAKFLDTVFATLLALRGRVNFRTLRRYCDYGERTMARQFRRCFDWPDFHQRVSTVARDPRSAVLSAQDASFLPQSGKPTFGLGHFCNGCPSRAERGLALSTLAVVEVTRRCACTLAVAQPPPGDDEPVSQPAKAETSVDVYRQHLRAQRHRWPPQVTSHGVDGYCAKTKSLAEAGRLDLHPMTKLRCDADGRFLSPGPHPKRRGARRQDAGKVNVHDRRRCASLGTMTAADQRHLSTAVVWPVTRKRKLRLVVVVNRNTPAKPRSSVLASTALALDGRKLVEWYGARFQSELLCRDSKPCTGLRDCQARAEAALACHCNAALATLNLARTAQLLEQTGAWPQVFSMASWKQRSLNERLLAVCIEKLALEPRWVKKHPSYDELRSYGAIAA
jgi:hypothetical protein